MNFIQKCSLFLLQAIGNSTFSTCVDKVTATACSITYFTSVSSTHTIYNRSESHFMQIIPVKKSLFVCVLFLMHVIFAEVVRRNEK
ncbi:T-complex protein 1 subunit gamma [Trichinella pseudospiralis]